MRLVADATTASWLDRLAGEADDFALGHGQRPKLEKHDVSRVALVSTFRSPSLFAGPDP
jgi:hypothetical protein